MLSSFCSQPGISDNYSPEVRAFDDRQRRSQHFPVAGAWVVYSIGIVAAAIAGLLGATTEASTACAALLLLVTFLSIIPIGLIWAQFEHVSLRKVTLESEHADEVLAADESANAAK